MRNKIHCMLTSSVALDSHRADVLFDTACLMIRDSVSRKLVRSEEIMGIITTSFIERTVGSIVGVEFNADVETELGSGKVRFLVRPSDVSKRNELVWVPAFTIEDILDQVMGSPASHSTRVH